jgi:hypothetical protein
VNIADITLCVASQRMFIFVSVYFVIDSVRKLLVASRNNSLYATNNEDKILLLANTLAMGF